MLFRKYIVKGGDFKMLIWKDRLVTALFMVVLIIITTVCFFAYQGYKNREAIAFAIQNPELVLNIRDRLASESAQVKAKMMVTAKTANEKLVEAVAEDLKK